MAPSQRGYCKRRKCPFLQSPDGCGHLASPGAVISHRPGRADGVALQRWLWALDPVCILAARIICGFGERSTEGHTLFLLPLVPLWNQLPFHFCFIGLLKGCQLDIGKRGFSLLQSAENKHQYGAI